LPFICGEFILLQACGLPRMRNDSNIGWIALTLREAAWAPLLVLGPVFLADWTFDVFIRFPWFDIPAHLLGGVAATYFFWRAAANARSVAGRFPKLSHAAFALACTAGATILWESFEFFSDRLLRTRMQHGLGDTLSDIVFSLAGGAAYLVLRRVFAAHRG
jgi:hypothetical protein